jgi:hypothetical protein
MTVLQKASTKFSEKLVLVPKGKGRGHTSDMDVLIKSGTNLTHFQVNVSINSAIFWPLNE